jgi:SAM-dependent methyltransferase/uncharacterized protein YbaR (Trm112 family)
VLNIKIFDMIKCTECSGIDFREVNLQAKGNVNELGALICEQCNQLYIIQEGILSLMRPELADKDRELAFIQTYFFDLPEIPAKKRIKALQHNRQSHADFEWVLSEKAYWDQNKYQKKSMTPMQYSWNRFEVRKRHVIDYIRGEVEGKTVAEFGGGNSGTLYYVMNPEKFRYTLVCTDISYNALCMAKHLHPYAILIQCDAFDPPFRDGIFDFLFEFGILHHLPNSTIALETHMRLLKEGGYLGFHEPIDRRPAFFPSIAKLKQISGKQSVHNDFISERDTIDYLNRYGKIIHQNLEYSPIRNWMVKLFVDIMGINSGWIHYLTVSLDQLIIKTIGRIWNRMDGSSLLLVWLKNI